MTGILAEIDAATDGLCACGCERPLPSDGPSGWWATEACQAVWQRGSRQKPGALGIMLPDGAVWMIDPEALRAALSRARETADHLFRAVTAAVQHMQPTFERLAAIAGQPRAEPPAEEVPTDPMERALYLRRHRNTGPKVAPRAPRRIDARRSR